MSMRRRILIAVPLALLAVVIIIFVTLFSERQQPSCHHAELPDQVVAIVHEARNFPNTNAATTIQPKPASATVIEQTPSESGQIFNSCREH